MRYVLVLDYINCSFILHYLGTLFHQHFNSSGSKWNSRGSHVDISQDFLTALVGSEWRAQQFGKSMPLMLRLRSSRLHVRIIRCGESSNIQNSNSEVIQTFDRILKPMLENSIGKVEAMEPYIPGTSKQKRILSIKKKSPDFFAGNKVRRWVAQCICLGYKDDEGCSPSHPA